MGSSGTPRPHLRNRPSKERSGERRWKGTTRSAKVEARATYVMELEADDVSIGYEETVAAVQRKFGCGIVAAQQAITRAHERQREAYREGDPELAAKAATFYLQLAAQAAKEKKYNAARMCMDSYRSMLGLGVPDRMKVELEEDVSMDDVTDAELERLLEKLEGKGAAGAKPETEH